MIESTVMTLLGIDYGTRRIGVAVSDDLGITAQALCTIERKTIASDLDRIARITEERGVTSIIIGYPVRSDGREGVECERVRRFAGRLAERCGLPVKTWDERFTTREAEELLLQADMSRKKRKKIIDRVAASLILQGYLDSSRRDTPHNSHEDP
ncbi:MAG: Holliday junction resolvase RuvX [Syntrophales bacterium]|nr:Holliday junction resolvase RuvX [Syntrophales bacterium]MCK9528607.1 Holliday junction resolvase RuvX [Syntrophales bacterium]MDX9923048.1 Holliday junction resolvase RuvX [Syntrophales bacterium]